MADLKKMQAINVLKPALGKAMTMNVQPSLSADFKVRPMIPLAPLPKFSPRPATPPPTAVPIPTPVQPAPSPVTLPPAAPTNPFELLPMPSAGDRIRAEDFRALSGALRIIYDASIVSATLFGRSFAEAKLLLAAQQYEIVRVITVLGTELTAIEDESLDDRHVVQVLPTALGEHGVLVVLTEPVDQRRYAPDLTAAPSYADAVALLRDRMGNQPASVTPVVAPDLIGRTLAELSQSQPPY